MKNIHEVQVGDWGHESVGSDRYPFRVVGVERRKDGRAKSIEVQYMSFDIDPSGYAREGWQERSQPNGQSRKVGVGVRGRAKDKVPGHYFGEAQPYLDPHF